MKRTSTLLALPLLAASAYAAKPALSPEVTVTRPTPTSIVLRWHSDKDTPGSVEVWQENGPHTTVPAENRNGGDYLATLSGLQPNTVTHYILRPQGSETASREQTTATLPPRGMVETETLPLLAIVYTPMHKPEGGPASGQNLSADDLALISSQLQDVRSFYFHATHGKLNLDWDVQADPTDVGNRPSLDPPPGIDQQFEASVERVLAKENKKIEDFAGVVFMFGWGEGDTPEAQAKVYRNQAFSGGTYGQHGNWKFDLTPYTMINFNHRADIRWTVTHEFGHQLDSMEDWSGHPSLAFNHPDPMTDVGVFGEHWDCNWWLLSRFPRDYWIALYDGQRRVSKDSDNDGLADDDPFLPMDEKRFGSNPKKADTDGDGLSDLDEYTTVFGITAGLNEVTAGAFTPPDPRKADTDGDGLKDGADPYPQYAVDATRRYATPIIDGVWLPGIDDVPLRGEWQPAGSLRFPANKEGITTGHAVNAGFGLQWDDQYLYVAMRANQPMDLLVDLDAENDGWFAGKDNYRLTLGVPPAGSTEPAIKSVIWDWSVFNDKADPNPYLNQSTEIVPASDIKAVARQENGTYVVEAAIPFNYHTGLRLYDGKHLGVRLGARVPGMKVSLQEFEPHRLMEMVLRRAY